MSDDILHNLRLTNSNMDLQFSHDIFNESLIRIEEKCIQINNKHINQLGLQSPTKSVYKESHILRDQKYDVGKLKIYVQQQKQLLNSEQKHVFETIMNNYNTKKGGIYFLDAPGGTGKVIKRLIDRIVNDVF